MKRTKLLAVTLAAAMMVSAMTACGSSKSASGSASGGSSSGAAASLPKSVSVQVPAKAGGGTDVMARALAQEVAEKSGSNFTIVNNADGNGVVACETVRTAKPDGATLLQFHTTMLIKTATGIYDKSAADDFTVIAVSKPVEKVSYVLCTVAGSDMDTFEKFIEHAKSTETKMGVETGGQVHILTGLLAKSQGLNVKYVDAGTDTEKMQNLVGGTIDAVIVNVNQAKQYIEAGKVNGLAVIGDGDKSARSSVLPDIKNLQELGVEDVTWSMYNFILGPKGMDDGLVKSIYQYYADAAKSEAVNKVLEPAGMAMEFVPQEEGVKDLQDMQSSINPVVEELGIKQQ